MLNSYVCKQLDSVRPATVRAAKIKEIIRLSDPPNPTVFQSHLEGWQDSRLDLRLKTLSDQSVHMSPTHQPDMDKRLVNISAALDPRSVPHSSFSTHR